MEGHAWIGEEKSCLGPFTSDCDPFEYDGENIGCICPELENNERWNGYILTGQYAGVVVGAANGFPR